MVNKKILIKEIDKYQSTSFENKTISEYLIYLMEDDVKVSAFTEIGEKAKKERVNMMFLSSFPLTINKDEHNSYIEEITLN
jgi:hypothetical protein